MKMNAGFKAASALGVLIALGVGLVLLPVGCSRNGDAVARIMKERKLSAADVKGALETYMPSGRHDDYYIFASGGHGGNMLVIGVPSMRILKYIGVFTPEPWQGYGYGDQTTNLLKASTKAGHQITWADMHHPALSETKGDYDGQFVFCNDKANPRVAVISLEDFTTRQIVGTEILGADHGATVVDPNTNYILETGQFAIPLDGSYQPLSDYKTKFRGAAVMWKFDRAKGLIDTKASFALELPPYMQDIADAGKLGSDGYFFVNSINTEQATGGTLEHKPALESGASQNDMDYMHIINWRKAAEVAAAGKTKTIRGMRVIPLDVVAKENLVYLLGEPKSPHGVDVAPNGEDIVVSGKLDTHTTIYSFTKMKALMDANKIQGRDAYGLPILGFKDCVRGQVEVGLGPLHSQFDGDGNVYTSLFIESAVCKWSLKDLKVLDKIPVQYNIGHLLTAEGDTVSPDGHYLVAMNKWAIDRFAKVGPLLPQNFQLIDISGKKMERLYDLPIPLGEPHYAQMIKADKVHPIDFYSPAGINPLTGKLSKFAFKPGEERIERKADGVHVYMSVIRSHFTPDAITVTEGDTVHLHMVNQEQTYDATHGFALDSYNISVSLEPGKAADVTFKANRAGVFPYYCTEFCSALHLEMAGYFMVKPKA